MVTRAYSISSSPDRADGCITITVKTARRRARPRRGQSRSMSRFLARDVKPGGYLTLGLPQGEFVIPEGAPVRPLFITGGSGITPVMSMIRTFALRRTMPSAVHVHYAPSARDTSSAPRSRASRPRSRATA